MSAQAIANSIRDPSDYLREVNNLLKDESWDSAEIASALLSINGPHSGIPCLHAHKYGSKRQRSFINFDAFDQIACLHLQVLYYIYENQNYENAYQTHTQIFQLFNTEVMQKVKDSNWYMPIFYILMTDLRNVAKMADDASEKDDEMNDSTTFYEECAKYVMEAYRTCVTDARKDVNVTKKVAMLNMTNQLFRIYFKINKLNLLKPLIRAIENSDTIYEHFSMADKVTYNYFLGRKAMFDADLMLAEKSLSYAFRNCPTNHSHNKRLILVYLVPVKMFLGHMPSVVLLKKYELDSFIEVVEAVKEGHLSRLDRALQTHEEFFIRCGIFLMLEKLRSITFRTLFKKVAHLLGKAQIPLKAFSDALQFQGVTDIEDDELECIVANLIFEKKLKGYISHQHRMVVVSKQNPFPALSSLVAS